MTARADIPTLQTERLILRAPRLADFEFYAAFYASGRSVFEDGPLSRAGAWKEFASAAALWSFRDYGSFTIEDRESGLYLGETGLFQPAHYPEPELGWMVVAEAEGRGIAREAALAVRDWAYGTLGLGPLVNYIDPGNERSIALALRLGATLDEDAEKPEDEDCVVYRHPEPSPRNMKTEAA